MNVIEERVSSILHVCVAHCLFGLLVCILIDRTQRVLCIMVGTKIE
jgi:hypothetical protein